MTEKQTNDAFRGLAKGTRVRCHAHSRSGAQCKKMAEPGATVCRMHGGASPQVRRAARIRLLSLVDPAITTLAREMTSADKSSDRRLAADSILDRAGVSRTTGVDLGSANALLAARLDQLRADAGLPPVHDTNNDEENDDNDDDE